MIVQSWCMLAKPCAVWYFLMIWSFSAKHCRLNRDFWPVQACVYLCPQQDLLLFPLLWTLVLSSRLQMVSPTWVYKILWCYPQQYFLILFVFNCELILMGIRTEETEQNRNYADCPKKMDSTKNSGTQDQCSVYWEERKREKPWDI